MMLTHWVSNYIFNEGGAICSTYSNVSFNKCIFNKNSINSGFSKGGAISMNLQSNLSLFECTFENNKIISHQSDSFGGAISLLDTILSCKKSIFINNLASSHSFKSNSRSDGGAISFYYRMNDEILNETFIDCSFTNNIAYSDYCLSYGGAIFYCKSCRTQITISFTSNELFQNLTFINNTAYSGKWSTYGGAIAYEAAILYPYQNVIQNRIFENLNFVNNTAISKLSSPQGGAICYLFLYSRYCNIKQNGTLNDSTFINNSAISSNSNPFGGAINMFSKLKDYSNAIEFGNNNVFNNNNAISYFSHACGGSIYFFNSKGKFQNCTFNSNCATQYGGCLTIWSSNFSFIECSFQNNTVNGKTFERGGAISSSESIVYLRKNSFINNILSPKNEFIFIFNIEGAACYFNNSEVCISDCDFINNTIKVMHYDKINIGGGAIYSSRLTKSFNSTNCVFINNSVYNNENNEFGGAIYLTNGILYNCTFINNIAYNGCDIKYDQIKNSYLCIKGCIFKQNKIENRIGIRSFIYFNVIYRSLFTNEFSNNRILNNDFLYLFDGEFSFHKIKFNFNDNCIYPFNSNSFTNGQFVIYNEIDEKVSFNSAFNSDCSEYVISQTPTFDNQQVDSKKENKKFFFPLICIMATHIIVVFLLLIWLVLNEIRKGNNDDIIDPLLDIDKSSNSI